MQALVRGRLCTAIDALATIARGHNLSHTLPTPEDVLRAFRQPNQPKP